MGLLKRAFQLLIKFATVDTSFDALIDRILWTTISFLFMTFFLIVFFFPK